MDFIAGCGKSAAGSDHEVLGFAEGASAADFEIHDQSLGISENDFQVIFGIADSGHTLQVGPQAHGRCLEELKGVVHDMGAPVEELPPAVTEEGLPVVASVIGVASEFDFEDLAEKARGDDFSNVLEDRFESAVMADEKGVVVSGGQRTEPFCIRQRGRHGFFDENDFASAEGKARVRIVIAGAGGDADEFYIGIGQHVFHACVSPATVGGLGGFSSFFKHIAYGCD